MRNRGLPAPDDAKAELYRRLESDGCIGEDEQGCTRDDDNIPLARWCVNCLAGQVLRDNEDLLRSRQRVLKLFDDWRAMVANASSEGALSGDEIGHENRWEAVSFCADELWSALEKL